MICLQNESNKSRLLFYFIYLLLFFFLNCTSSTSHITWTNRGCKVNDFSVIHVPFLEKNFSRQKIEMHLWTCIVVRLKMKNLLKHTKQYNVYNNKNKRHHSGDPFPLSSQYLHLPASEAFNPPTARVLLLTSSNWSPAAVLGSSRK